MPFSTENYSCYPFVIQTSLSYNHIIFKTLTGQPRADAGNSNDRPAAGRQTGASAHRDHTDEEEPGGEANASRRQRRAASDHNDHDDDEPRDAAGEAASGQALREEQRHTARPAAHEAEKRFAAERNAAGLQRWLAALQHTLQEPDEPAAGDGAGRDARLESLGWEDLR